MPAFVLHAANESLVACWPANEKTLRYITVERSHRVHQDLASSMLAASTLAGGYFGYALEYAAMLRNALPAGSAGVGPTPYEAITGRPAARSSIAT